MAAPQLPCFCSAQFVPRRLQKYCDECRLAPSAVYRFVCPNSRSHVGSTFYKQPRRRPNRDASSSVSGALTRENACLAEVEQNAAAPLVDTGPQQQKEQRETPPPPTALPKPTGATAIDWCGPDYTADPPPNATWSQELQGWIINEKEPQRD
jgi:hypothetical protein